MNVLLATAEAVPFAKTGGLGDVCGALPRALARLGENTAVILPAYRSALKSGQALNSVGSEFAIPIGSKQVVGSLLESRLPGTNVPVYLVRQDHYFDRPEIYREQGVDYIDNCERSVFFCRAVLETIRQLELRVDVLHCNDWTTGLLPALLKTEYRGVPHFEHLVSLMTIHNLAYQGTFWHWDMALTGLDWKYFNWQQMEFYGQLNLLKTGLAFADAINTVSPRYAEEIQSAPLGCGLEGLLQHRREVVSGILNGCDYDEWNPATDAHLPERFDVNSYAVGKARCKQALQEELGLPVDPRVPLVAFVGRLSDQKGIDLVEAVIKDWVQHSDVQWAILGTGEPTYHERFALLADRHPHRVAVRLMFSEPLAHRIEAGADLFLMPSRYEPCGLNQMYSLRYGTVPVVRATGGLADTITDATDAALADGTANGFSFQEYSPLALSEKLRHAVTLRETQPEVWGRLLETGMRQDWSWDRSARQYVELYEKMLARQRQAVLN
ncbi:MAG: glycogen synthase GlgA [Pirellulales bacterium]|nr:glycogen synthase GlgA [Pirellulales bacterium]